MKLVKKNNYAFATGMFWQIPDEGKRTLNFSKLVKDTKNNMYCNIKILNTWGFCRKEELVGEKKVASFGKFIIEASGLSTEYANSIICFKFKSAGEIDEDGKRLDSDLYGYIVLLNGSICPDEGEYVAKIEMVRSSIYEQATKHNIETLYLPVEVSGQFFNIFEILDDASNNDKLLLDIMNNISKTQVNELKDFINQNFMDNQEYKNLVNDPLDVNLDDLKSLIKTGIFEKKLRSSKEKNLKYLIANILILSYTSDEIFWQPEKLKKYFMKSLIYPTAARTMQNYKIAGAGILFILLGYIFYDFIFHKEEIEKPKQVQKPMLPRPVAADPMQIISACLGNKDQYFVDMGNWTLSSIKCNSLGGVYTFNSSIDTTITEFSKLIGKNDNSIRFANKVGIYTQSFKLMPTRLNNSRVPREVVLSNLQQSVINYGIKISIPQTTAGQKNKLNAVTKYTIISNQSPVFLFNHNVLDNVKVSDISMSFDKNNGFYSWTIQGEF
jgi:hypothetical protein